MTGWLTRAFVLSGALPECLPASHHCRLGCGSPTGLGYHYHIEFGIWEEFEMGGVPVLSLRFPLPHGGLAGAGGAGLCKFLW